MLVYLAVNKVNGKKYIGYTTKSLHERIKNHVIKAYSKNGKHYNYFFQRAIRKHSIDSFEWSVIQNCSSKDECCEIESKYILEYDSIYPNGYNLTLGGDGGIPCDEVKKKISKSLRNYFSTNSNARVYLRCLTKEERTAYSKKAWETKRSNGYKRVSGVKMSEESVKKLRETKNKNNRIWWINLSTKDVMFMSMSEMSIHTNLSVGVFNHIKHGRQTRSKCGWSLFKVNNTSKYNK